MRHLLLPVFLSLALGCSPSAIQTQVTLANAVAIAANAALPRVVEVYRQAGIAIIATSDSRATAETRLVQLMEEWAPVWGNCGPRVEGTPPVTTCTGGAWHLLETAHAAWTRALERRVEGQEIDLTEAVSLANDLRTAYCELRATLPGEFHLPDVPVLPCPAPTSLTRGAR